MGADLNSGQRIEMERRVGEIIASESRILTAQCYELQGAPPLGSLVAVGDPRVFAVVQDIRTEPIDTSRPILARGREAQTPEEIYRENPQLDRLLTTRFQALIVGYQEGSHIFQLLPPTPPPIHSFVYDCSPTVVARFTENLDFCRFLIGAGGPMADEVVVAYLRSAVVGRADEEQFLMRAGQALSRELIGESARLSAILKRVRQ